MLERAREGVLLIRRASVEQGVSREVERIGFCETTSEWTNVLPRENIATRLRAEHMHARILSSFHAITQWPVTIARNMQKNNKVVGRESVNICYI